jgi:hypothetical protein
VAATQKVSISVDAEQLKWLRRRARERGGNLSAVFQEAARLLRQKEARERLLDRLGDQAKVSPAEADAIRAEWQA